MYALETKTGRIAAELPYANTMQYDYALNNAGGGSVNIPTGGNGMSADDLNEMTQPWRWSLAICYRGTVVQAGPIVSETFTDSQSYTQVTFAGMWKTLSKRLLLPASFADGGGNPAVPACDTTYTNLTYRQIASNIVATTLTRGTLPITLPDPDPPGTHAMTYFGYDMDIIADMLTNLTGLVDGPEIEFHPQFVAGQPDYIEWLLRVGAPRLGNLGSPWVWDYGARGALQALDFTRDGSQMTFASYTRGSGNQYGLLVGSALDSDFALVDVGYPLLEDVNGDHTSVTDPATLNSYARQLVSTYEYPVETMIATIRVNARDVSGLATGSPTLDQVAIGDTAVFSVEDHRRIPDGNYPMRIVGVGAGQDYYTAKLTLQSIVGKW